MVHCALLDDIAALGSLHYALLSSLFFSLVAFDAMLAVHPGILILFVLFVCYLSCYLAFEYPTA